MFTIPDEERSAKAAARLKEKGLERNANLPVKKEELESRRILWIF